MDLRPRRIVRRPAARARRSGLTSAALLIVWAVVRGAAPAAAADAPISLVREVAVAPGESEAGLPGPLRLEATTFEATEETVGEGMTRVTFPSPVKSGHVPNDTVHTELHLPAGATPGRRPAVIFLHYLDGDLTLPRVFCRTFAINGVSALLVKMPYYHERREGTDRRMVTGDAGQTVAAVRQAALDVRYARAYLAARPDVDPSRIGVGGMSLGGIVGSLAFEIEPRLDRGCFLLAGADLPTLLWDSRLTAKSREAWERAGVTKSDLAKAFAVVDPASYAGRRAGRPALLLCGRGDDVMPEACTLALATALGEPEVVWYGGGHKPGAADVADALLRTSAFFAAKSEAGPRP